MLILLCDSYQNFKIIQLIFFFNILWMYIFKYTYFPTMRKHTGIFDFGITWANMKSYQNLYVDNSKTEPCYSNGKRFPKNKTISVSGWGLWILQHCLNTETCYWHGFIFWYSHALWISDFGIAVVFYLQHFGMNSWYFTIYYWESKGTIWSVSFTSVIPIFSIFVSVFFVQYFISATVKNQNTRNKTS